MLELLQFLPVSLMEFFNDNNPSRRMAGIRKVTKVANGVAKELVSTKSEALLEGKGKKDIMSLLGQRSCSDSNLYLIGAFSQSQCWRRSQGPAQRGRTTFADAVCTIYIWMYPKLTGFATEFWFSPGTKPPQTPCLGFFTSSFGTLSYRENFVQKYVPLKRSPLCEEILNWTFKIWRECPY